ncbi:hypothetical protein AG1IA_02963 [Rhizoctonia solani AG-1 IA]|uniref:Uncharacterized protein n=1 Tax=Thanatephorus cucumeris (strain AG1-IA) TaxID=983506 RepID=L8X1V3_THACA|nr:hypothetical protein AG1IA_02963 [Rhizoctonia solani AG-1 IA]
MNTKAYSPLENHHPPRYPSALVEQEGNQGQATPYEHIVRLRRLWDITPRSIRPGRVEPKRLCSHGHKRPGGYICRAG